MAVTEVRRGSRADEQPGVARRHHAEPQPARHDRQTGKVGPRRGRRPASALVDRPHDSDGRRWHAALGNRCRVGGQDGGGSPDCPVIGKPCREVATCIEAGEFQWRPVGPRPPGVDREEQSAGGDGPAPCPARQTGVVHVRGLAGLACGCGRVHDRWRQGSRRRGAGREEGQQQTACTCSDPHHALMIAPTCHRRVGSCHLPRRPSAPRSHAQWPATRGAELLGSDPGVTSGTTCFG